VRQRNEIDSLKHKLVLARPSSQRTASTRPGTQGGKGQPVVAYGWGDL
jgi:hypothetical protein